MKSLAEFVRSTPFFVIAHRGASGEAPENTKSAIELALHGGALMVEVDVQVTQDEELVVFHDHILGRTTNGHGKVANTRYEDLRKLDAGSWFSPEFAKEVVPRLDEVLDLVAGRAYLNLEVKPLHENPRSKMLIQQVVNVIQEHGHAPYTVYSSFDHEALRLVKVIDPLAHTAALNVPGDSRLPSQVVGDCGADAYGCSTKELTKKKSDDLRRHRIPWGVYTVNTDEELEHALEYKVGSVVSNLPGNVWKMYEKRKKQ